LLGLSRYRQYDGYQNDQSQHSLRHNAPPAITK